MRLGPGIAVTSASSIAAVPLEPDLDAAIRALFENDEEGAWYDPSDLSTVWQDAAGTTPATAGDPVGRIDDKSGNGNHATQSTSTARPTLQTSGGLYYLEFVVDDFMQTAAFASPLAQPNFISLAGLLPDSTSVSALYFDGLASGSRHYSYANKNSTAILVGTDGGSYSGTEPDGTSTNVWSFNFDGASSYLRQDGTQVATGNTGATTFGGLTLMGNITPVASPHTTNMHGFVLVNRALTGGEIDDLESYLAEKSGVTL